MVVLYCDSTGITECPVVLYCCDTRAPEVPLHYSTVLHVVPVRKLGFLGVSRGYTSTPCLLAAAKGRRLGRRRRRFDACSGDAASNMQPCTTCCMLCGVACSPLHNLDQESAPLQQYNNNSHCTPYRFNSNSGKDRRYNKSF